MKHITQLNFTVVTLVSAISFGLTFAQDYQFRDKKDPFLSLIQVRSKPAPRKVPVVKKRPPGLAGLYISEVTVVGTAQKADTGIVILKGPDNFSYVVGPGAKLLDGYLESLSAGQAVFAQKAVGGNGKEAVRKVVKQGSSEAR